MQWTPKDFEQDCCIKAYHDEYVMAFAKHSVPLLNRDRSARSASINIKEHGMAEPVTFHDIYQSKKQC
jgi:hypothetical protein